MSDYKEYGYFNNQLSGEHKYILPALLKQLHGAKAKSILDIGCGNGSVAYELLSKGFDVYGIDASLNGITWAKTKCPERFFLSDVTDKNLPDALLGKKFDTIISVEVIEHLYDPRSFVQFCKAILLNNQGGGNIILTTPYHGYLKNLILALINKYDKHLDPLWDGGHIKFWSKDTLTKLLEEAGFTVEEFQGAGRLPLLWKSMVLLAKLK